MRYSKEAYESEQAKLRDAEEHEREVIEGQRSASQAEKLADFTYANVAGVLDYLLNVPNRVALDDGDLGQRLHVSIP